MKQSIRTSDFNYELPERLIAEKPVNHRDSSRLLINRKGHIEHSTFEYLADALPENAALLFNNTRVIRARLNFRKPTGARIELFCLEPAVDSLEYAFEKKGTVKWKCLVGNARKWKNGQQLQLHADTENGKSFTLNALCTEKEGDAFIIEFNWNPSSLAWKDILLGAGHIPLPPYINRTVEADDNIRYQTLFARKEGAVAAPTAGLHFSEQLMSRLSDKGLPMHEITLHTGMGTFKPVECEDPQQHDIHRETMLVDRKTMSFLRSNYGNLIMVGTTALRTIESLYWMGLWIHENGYSKTPYVPDPEWISKKCRNAELPDPLEMIGVLENWMDENGMNHFQANTRLYILPGYTFRYSSGLITNFHLPRSTLLMLVSAFIGDQWKAMYEEAVNKDYRFLSYGDGSLLLP